MLEVTNSRAACEGSLSLAVQTVVPGRLNVIKGLKPTKQIVSLRRSRHLISLGQSQSGLRIYLPRDHSSFSICSQAFRKGGKDRGETGVCIIRQDLTFKLRI